MIGHRPALPVLLLDDEGGALEDVRDALRSGGITNTVTLQDIREAVAYFEGGNRASAAVVDIGTEILPRLTRTFPELPVIVMSGTDCVETAVSSMKQGAFDYLLKPFDAARLVSSVTRAVRQHGRSDTFRTSLLNDSLRHPEAFFDIITCSRNMRSIFQYVEAISNSRQPVLVTGETGVGKELIARSIHALSGVPGEFVTVNVAGLDDNLFADTLFGHKKGAFTGADQPREGLIRKAAGGTLFLDEIGDLAESSQLKLLRLLQEQEYYMVGSDALQRSNARIIASTNRNLQALLPEGTFRKDLYYRLCAHPIEIPPLRDRRGDIPLLLGHFVEAASRQLGRRTPEVSADLCDFLASFDFSGNVRELQGMVLDAVVRAGGVLAPAHFSPQGETIPEKPPLPVPPRSELLFSLFGRFPTVVEVEKFLIGEALTRTNGNKTAAASLLGMTRPTLNKRLLGGM